MLLFIFCNITTKHSRECKTIYFYGFLCFYVFFMFFYVFFKKKQKKMLQLPSRTTITTVVNKLGTFVCWLTHGRRRETRGKA